MKEITITIEQWNSLKDSKGMVDIPVWFQVTGNSMFPFIRAFQDKVMIVCVPVEQYKIGDIVLFPAKRQGGDYCLHRLYKMDAVRVQTFGDGCKYPDGWIAKNQLLGKAILIKRGKTTIDCEAPRWVRRFRRWNYFWKIRSIMLFPFRVKNKCERVFGKILKKNDEFRYE